VPVPALSFLLAGALVAGDVRLSLRGVVALVIGVGLLHGYANGVAFRGPGGTLGLIGVAALTFVVVALLAAFVVSLAVAWARVAVRVAGSWIAASGLLLLGWSLR
jgi:urease accessory protein